MQNKLIIALDFNLELEAWALVDKLEPNLCALKVGNEMFTLFGPEFVKKLVAKGYKVFLDLKFHDIPNTVSRACKAAADLGVWMLSVHAAGGWEMLCSAKAALENLHNTQRPLLIAVTVLTSMHDKDLLAIGLNMDVNTQVLNLARLANNCGLDGVVASALEVTSIKKECGQDFVTITPGIRLDNNNFDQKRVVTPKEAYALGSDYLVIGRPISQARDPLLVIRNIYI